MHKHGSYSLADDETELPCVILNISETGALLGKMAPIAPGSAVELDIAEIGDIPARVVRCTERGVAVEFSDRI